MPLLVALYIISCQETCICLMCYQGSSGLADCSDSYSLVKGLSLSSLLFQPHYCPMMPFTEALAYKPICVRAQLEHNIHAGIA